MRMMILTRGKDPLTTHRLAAVASRKARDANIQRIVLIGEGCGTPGACSVYIIFPAMDDTFLKDIGYIFQSHRFASYRE